MLLVREQSLIEVLCPAKLNLYLEVKGKRPDGYHELETIMQTISLYDRLLIQPSGSEGEIRVECDDASIPCDERNTVWRAAAEVRREVRRETGAKEGLLIRIQKRIPAGAGLAGGSSDAAGTIAALNLLWEAGLPRERLAEIGARVGSDVPFFFTAGTALCRGRGELVTPLERPGAMHFVVAWPGFEIPTREIFGRLGIDLTGPRGDDSISALTGHLARGEPASAGSRFFNRLQETAEAAYGGLAATRLALARTGLLGVTMTGSGSAFFGLCDRKEVAQEARRQLMDSGLAYVFACEATRN